MACRKQEISVQQLQLVVLNRNQVGRVRHLINLAGTLARRMRSPLASLRWELAKRRVPRKGNLPEPESACEESAVALAGF
jgi:hypothetical protein